MDDCCKPGLASSQYERGPTDKNPAMFPFEKKQADAIASRGGGPATSPQTDKPTPTRFTGPGSNDR